MFYHSGLDDENYMDPYEDIEDYDEDYEEDPEPEFPEYDDYHGQYDDGVLL